MVEHRPNTIQNYISQRFLASSAESPSLVYCLFLCQQPAFFTRVSFTRTSVYKCRHVHMCIYIYVYIYIAHRICAYSNACVCISVSICRELINTIDWCVWGPWRDSPPIAGSQDLLVRHHGDFPKKVPLHRIMPMAPLHIPPR